ncbi:MAG: type I-D CRISPR-associated helicase Cas3' [Nitrospira sp.]|nr:type I-D CRISPR-associated helicase Cas3' [Nitrospira sp.]
MRISELRLPLIEHTASRYPLYPHQLAMWEGWEQHSTMLLAAKTGTGKTRAAMLPVLKRREWALAVYPTNELLRDQVRAVEKFVQEEGIATLVWTPEVEKGADRADRHSHADYILIPVDGALLDQWQEVMRCKNRGETLRRLLNPDKPKIVFTNPDILFLILGLRYHAEPFEALRRYETLIMDEFHLYHGVELAHALMMVALARGFGIFRRLILLSATPPPEVQALLDRAVRPVVIDSKSESHPAPERWRTAVHAVDVTPIQVTGGDPVEVLLSHLVSLKPEFERLRNEIPADDYLPAVVIANSVLSAIRLEDRLVESGFSRDALAIIRGLSHRAIRNTKGKLLAIGTSAIEVGVDFRCDYLLFEAWEAASFLQRFGRVGRHRPGKAVILMPPNAFVGITTLPPEIDRAAFEERIHAWYPSATYRSWFVTTEHGMITARALAENLVATVEKDEAARPEILVQLREKIEAILADHADRLGCCPQNLQAKTAFERCAAGKKNVQWLKTYRQLNRFRTSLPSRKVHDFSEQHRRQDWEMGEYEADLATLLKRGVELTWNEKLGMLTIKGIGKYRQVHASEIFRDDDCDMILETRNFPLLRLYQDGESTPVSDLMGRQNHIFTVVPKTVVQEELDWRLHFFEAGPYLLAFDGAALLLMELRRRRPSNPEDEEMPCMHDSTPTTAA